MNAVPIDDAEIAQKLEGVAGEFIPRDEGPQPQPEQQAEPKPDFTMLSACIVVIVDKVCVPNWELTKDEKDLLQSQIINVSEHWMPHMLVSPRWAAVIGLCGSMFALAMPRLEDGGLKPMRRPTSSTEANEEANPSSAHYGTATNGAGFSTAN